MKTADRSRVSSTRRDAAGNVERAHDVQERVQHSSERGSALQRKMLSLRRMVDALRVARLGMHQGLAAGPELPVHISLHRCATNNG
jgi:hypothetical protein